MRSFVSLYTCAPGELPRTFDAITMVHSLEHFANPLAVLEDLRAKLTPDGRLFVQVPNAEANPMDLAVADHMSHFTPATLSRLCVRAGYEVESVSTLWISKELSLTAKPAGEPSSSDDTRGADALRAIRAQISWLCRLRDAANEAARTSENFGIFGATIAASWICGFLGGAVKFFVDEDTNRVGRTHLDRPVLATSQVPAGSVVLLALTPAIAARVASRLRNSSVDYRLPPEVPDVSDADVK